MAEKCCYQNLNSVYLNNCCDDKREFKRTQSNFQIKKENKKGKQGHKGEPGPRGKKGDPGSKGKPGEPGPKGESGSRGMCGISGNPGPKGKSGEPGPKGICGSCGPQGSRGIRGIPGNPGPCGSPGNRGPCGSPGNRGPCGSPGNRGPCGSPGNPGPCGSPGNPGPSIIVGACISNIGSNVNHQMTNAQHTVERESKENFPDSNGGYRYRIVPGLPDTNYIVQVQRDYGILGLPQSLRDFNFTSVVHNKTPSSFIITFLDPYGIEVETKIPHTLFLLKL